MKLVWTESRMVVARPWEKGRIGSYCLKGVGFQFGRMTSFWRLMMLMVEQQCEYSSCHRTRYLSGEFYVTFILSQPKNGKKNIKKRTRNRNYYSSVLNNSVFLTLTGSKNNLSL